MRGMLDCVSLFPVPLHTAIDAPDCRGLAEFYRKLLGWQYRQGDDPPTDGTDDDADWLVLVDSQGQRMLAVQEKLDMSRPTWPSEEASMQLHMDFGVSTVEELQRHRARAEALGATLLQDRTGDEDEPLFVLADPAGHPFCLLLVP